VVRRCCGGKIRSLRRRRLRQIAGPRIRRTREERRGTAVEVENYELQISCFPPPFGHSNVPSGIPAVVTRATGGDDTYATRLRRSLRSGRTACHRTPTQCGRGSHGASNRHWRASAIASQHAAEGAPYETVPVPNNERPSEFHPHHIGDAVGHDDDHGHNHGHGTRPTRLNGPPSELA